MTAFSRGISGVRSGAGAEAGPGRGSRRAIRTAVAVGTVSLGLVALSACDKPSPNAHFTVGSQTTSQETAVDCHGHGEALEVDAARACLEETEGVSTLTAAAGETFRLGVDPAIAETGWLLFLNGQPLDVQPYTSTYRTFPAEQLFAAFQQQGQPLPEEVQVNVVQVVEGFDPDALLASSQADPAGFMDALLAEVEGVWNVQLEPEQ